METLWKEVEGSVYSDESIPRPGPTPMRCVDTDEPFENIKMSFRLFLGQWHSVSKPAHATPPPALLFSFVASDFPLYLCSPVSLA